MHFKNLKTSFLFLFIFFSTSCVWAVVPPPCEDLELGENWFCVGEYIFPNGDVYYGEFKNHDSFKNGIPHGPGELTIKDGTRFLGLFKNGKLNGVGTEYSSNGVLVKRGLYIEGKFEASVKTLDYEEETNSFHDKAIKEVFANLIYVKDCAGRELEDGQMCWGFRPITVDLNLDGFNEIIVMHTAPGYCGSGGCSSFILQKDLEKDSWFTIGEVWPSYWDNMHVSSKMTDGFFDIIIGEHICTGHPYECIE